MDSPSKARRWRLSGWLVSALILLVSSPALAQFTSIQNFYAALPGVVGTPVSVFGFYSDPSDQMLVCDYQAFQEDCVGPSQCKVFLDGPQPGALFWFGGSVTVFGIADTVRVTNPRVDADSLLAIIHVSHYTGPEGTPIAPYMGSLDFRGDSLEPESPMLACDSCKFAILISGGVDAANNQDRYWNNLKMLFKHKKDNEQYCPDAQHMKVFYFQGTTKDAAAIPQAVVDSCTVAKIDAAHKAVAARVAACARAGKKPKLQILVTNHGSEAGGINTLGDEEMTGAQLRGMIQGVIDSSLADLDVEMVQCYGGQPADSLRKLNGRGKTRINVMSGQGGEHPHRSDVDSTGGNAIELKRKLERLAAGDSYEEAVRKGLAAYDSLLKAQGLEERRKKSVHWRSFPFTKYSEWEEVEVAPGGQLIIEFSGPNTSCGNITVYEKQPDGTKKKVAVWNWNVPGSSGYVVGNEKRVVNADTTSSGTFYIHNDNGPFTALATSSMTQALAATPSNVAAYSGFSAGLDDGVAAEFGAIVSPTVFVGGIDQPGFSLAALPQVFGPVGVPHVDASFSNSGNPFWSDMEVVFDVQSVISPGSVVVSAASQFGSVSMPITNTGLHSGRLGFVTGNVLSIQSGGSFVVDWWALRVTQGAVGVPEDLRGFDGVFGDIVFANPFVFGSEIKFSLDRPAHARLRIYDVSGRLVATILDSRVPQSGRQTVAWDGRGASGSKLSSGVYFVQLTADGKRASSKMLILR